MRPNGPPPIISIATSKRDRTAAFGIATAYWQRCFRDHHGSGYVGRVIKKLDKRLGAILGVFHALPSGEFQVEAVERNRER